MAVIVGTLRSEVDWVSQVFLAVDSLWEANACSDTMLSLFVLRLQWSYPTQRLNVAA